MIYLVKRNPKKQKCFLELCENFEELVGILELTPFYYDIYATMDQLEADKKYEEWRVKYYDCNSKI